ncbi:MAG: hypothetical protein ACXWKN_12955, partial [Phenylobacterium sp.]
PLAWARRFGSYSKDIVAHARDAFGTRLAVIEQTLADGREYLVAGRLTVADLSVGFALTLSPLLGLRDLLPLSVASYRDRLRARPAYRRAYSLD